MIGDGHLGFSITSWCPRPPEGPAASGTCTVGYLSGASTQAALTGDTLVRHRSSGLWVPALLRLLSAHYGHRAGLSEATQTGSEQQGESRTRVAPGSGPGEELLLALCRKFKVKSPGDSGYRIKDRKGAEETYYFLSIDFPPKGSLTWVSSEFIHHLNGQAKTAINF